MCGAAEPALYEIHIQGYLDDHRIRRFAGMEATRLSNGVTVLAGPVADQAALHGLLHRVRDLGAPLLLVRHMAYDSPRCSANAASLQNEVREKGQYNQ